MKTGEGNVIASQSSQRIKRNIIYKNVLNNIHSWETHAKKSQIDMYTGLETDRNYATPIRMDGIELVPTSTA